MLAGAHLFVGQRTVDALVAEHQHLRARRDNWPQSPEDVDVRALPRAPNLVCDAVRLGDHFDGWNEEVEIVEHRLGILEFADASVTLAR